MRYLSKVRPLFFFALLPVLFLGVSSCSVSDKGAVPTGATQQVYPMFTDINSNGINDYFEQATHDAGSYARVSSGGYGHGWVDENGDGICDWSQNGSATWHGPGFVDTNGDGVCDYWQDNSPMHNQNGGMNFHDSNGNGVNDYMEEPWHMGYGHEFTDQDGDGICDYAQNGTAGIYHGPGYHDNDNNGVCDNWQTGGAGYGGGGMGGGHGPGMM